MMNNKAAPIQELKAPTVPHYAWLEVGGRKANLYNIKTEGKFVSAYVEAEVGAEVALCSRNEANKLGHDLGQVAVADGSEFDGVFWRKTEPGLSLPPDHPDRVHKFAGTRVGKREERRLMVVALEYTEDDDRACSDLNVLRNLGTIKLQLIWGRAEEVPARRHVYPKGPTDQAPPPRSLETVLDLDQRTALEGTRRVPSQARHYWTERDGGVPFAEFKFYYRSKEILQRRGILAPATPPPSKPPSARSSPSAHSGPATASVVTTATGSQVTRLEWILLDLQRKHDQLAAEVGRDREAKRRRRSESPGLARTAEFQALVLGRRAASC